MGLVGSSPRDESPCDPKPSPKPVHTGSRASVLHEGSKPHKATRHYGEAKCIPSIPTF